MSATSSFRMTERTIPLDESHDVIVVGGGPAGCAAATASSREGARTLLIEANSALGGMGTLGLVPEVCGYDDGEKIISRGLAEHVRNVLTSVPHLRRSKNNPLLRPSIDPEILKRAYDDMVLGTGATVLFHTQLTAVEMSSPDLVNVIICANKSGLVAFKAPLYIDCTGDGDLAAWAGAPFEKGDENGSMQPGTHCFVLTHIDPHALAVGPHLHYSDPGSPMHKIVKSDKYPLIVDFHTGYLELGPTTWGFNTGHVYDVDNTDPVSLSKSLVAGRKLAAQYRDAFAEFHPAFANSMLVATGALQGIRETRRIIGDYLLNLDDYNAWRFFPDEVCRNAFGVDIHFSREEALAFAKMTIPEMKAAWKVRRDDRKPPKGKSVGIPYRCLTPKGISNLLVAGRCISTDRLVNGSTRIMACCLNTGEAAGIAAALALRSDRDVHHVDAGRLRELLKSYGAWLPDPD